MIALRLTALHVAALASLVALQPVRVCAQWWHRAPADYEECAEAAEKSATSEQKNPALAECNAKFAGRRKPGGGYTYYDFMQNRSFDIVGPNPTTEEQKRIDEQYAIYLENQRRSNLAAAVVAKQPEVRETSLKSDVARVPLPQQRPKPPANGDARTGQRPAECTRPSLSCEWPHLSEAINDLKKKLFGSQPSKTKRDDRS